MSVKKHILAAAFLSLAVTALMTLPIAADDSDQAVEVSFNTPVEVPNNVTLPPGTYWIEKLNRGMGSGEMVMEISNASRTRVITTAMLQPVERRRPAGHPFVGVTSDNSGQPVALTGWYYPGHSIGYEFVYSHRQRDQIREETQADILVSRGTARVTTSLGGN